jgi:hypothetical protein
MTSISWHDFLLGATSLCMAACASGGFESPYSGKTTTLDLLERASAVCHERGTAMSKGTARVQSVISATIRQFGQQSSGEEVENSQLGSTDQTMSSSRGDDAALPGEADWPWTDNIPGTFDDPNWTYLDQYLGLPSYDT